MTSNSLLNLALAVVVALYAYKRYEIPTMIKDVVNNDIFRLVFLTVFITPVLRKTPSLAVTLAILFLMTLYYINEQEKRENMIYVESYRQQLHLIR